MATSQPISLPGYQQEPHEYMDYPMSSTSPLNQDPEFNPASYQRHFLGSPISWKMGSFGNRYIPSQSPTARLLNGFDPGAKGSVESDRGSIINAFNVFNAEVPPGDYARNYSCCNLQLNDLHALLEHFEEVHIVRQPPGFDSTAANVEMAVPFHPVPVNGTYPAQQQNQFAQAPNGQQQLPYGANNGFDPDDMDLGDDESSQRQVIQSMQQQQQPNYATTHSSPESATSSTPPPETPLISTPANVYAQSHPHPHQQYYNSYIYNPTPLKSSTSSLDGALGGGPTNTTLNQSNPNSAGSSPTKCVTPSLLFDQGPMSSSAAEFGKSAKESRGTKSMPGTPLRASPPPLPLPNSKKRFKGISGSSSSSSLAGALTDTTAASTSSAALVNGISNGANATTLAHLSAATLATLTGLTSSKPFKCPKENCNKSYKQANGLKYHMTHGSCVFTPPREVEQVRAIIGEHQRARLAANASGEESMPGSPSEATGGEAGLTLSESELKELEREADKRLRPFACGVGDCSRRYKNMNGLRYHYQHSGDHGAIGLAMLANGTHECIAQNQASGHGDKAIERGRARYGGVPPSSDPSMKKERSKSNRHDGISSASTSRNGSRVGTPIPSVPPILTAAAQNPISQQPPSQQSQQSTFPQNPPSTQTLSLQLQPVGYQPQQPSQSSAGYSPHHRQAINLSTQMSQLGVQSAPASPLYSSAYQGAFAAAQAQHLQQQQAKGSLPPSPLGLQSPPPTPQQGMMMK